MTAGLAIRLSPSGPVVGNAGGAPFMPGPGARLRLVEQGFLVPTAAAANVIPTAPGVLGPAGIGVGNGQNLILSVPNPALNYRATILCDVSNPSTNVLGEVQLYLEVSTDGGVTYVERASNTHLVNSTEVAPAAPLGRQIRLDLQLTAGLTLGVPAAAPPAMFVRAKIGASSGGGTVTVLSLATPGGDLKSVGTALLQLEECL
jgi:hypothetical protein